MPGSGNSKPSTNLTRSPPVLKPGVRRATYFLIAPKFQLRRPQKRDRAHE